MPVNLCPSLRVHFDGGRRGIILISRRPTAAAPTMESQALAANRYLNLDIVGDRPIHKSVLWAYCDCRCPAAADSDWHIWWPRRCLHVIRPIAVQSTVFSERKYAAAAVSRCLLLQTEGERAIKWRLNIDVSRTKTPRYWGGGIHRHVPQSKYWGPRVP